MQIRSFRSFLNRSTTILMDCCYNKNSMGLWVTEMQKYPAENTEENKFSIIKNG